MTNNRSAGWWRGAALGVLVAACAGQAVGHGAFPQLTPVDRIVTNLEKYVKEHPGEAEAYYRLGRAHTMALETKSEEIIAWQNREPGPRPAEGSWALPRRNEKSGKKSTPQELRHHLAEAIRNLNKAIELAPTEARYRLTLGCAMEAGASLNDDHSLWPLAGERVMQDAKEPLREETFRYAKEGVEKLEKPEDVDKLIVLFRQVWGRDWSAELMTLAFRAKDSSKHPELIEQLRTTLWNDVMERQYFTAMTFGLVEDHDANMQPIWGGMEDWVSYEAAKDYLRVVAARQARPSDQIGVKTATAVVDAFDKLPPPNGITPIIFGTRAQSLARLTSSRASRFDLEGSGRSQRWSWVTPDAGILVWDPAHNGEITSGRQLFGNSSWWIFFDNGYQALDALDDNRDGELAGAELDGIRVWFDRNSDGVCSPGEVVDLSTLDIVALSTRQTGVDGICPMNSRGVRLADGRELPTYDWIATSVPESEGLGGVRPVALSGFMSGMAVLGLVAGFGSVGARRRRGASVAAEPENQAKTETHPNPSHKEGLRTGECRDDE